MSRLLRFHALFPVIFLLLLSAAGSTSFAQTADFTASPTSGCAPMVVNWNLGNGATPMIQNPSTIYASPGTYTVSLTVTGPGGSNTITKTAFITVYSKPTVSFTATPPLAGCTPLTVQFSSTVTPNAPGSVTYNWDFGDGYSGTGAGPTHIYVTSGTYPVSLTVTNGAGCDTTVVRNAYITAYPKPSGGFSANQNAFCSTPATVNFTNTSTGGVPPYSTYWTFGDGGNGTGTTITHNYTTGGNFTVTMIVTDSRGCVDTVINPAYITVIGTLPTFTAPAATCVDASVNFINTTSGTSGNALWDFDDGSTATGNNVSHVYASSGTYNVMMSVIIGGCPKTITKRIVVNPKPVPVITMSPSIPCPAPVTVTFSGSSPLAAVTNYDWSWLSGGTASGQTVTKNYTSNIQDKVKLITTSAAGCKDSAIMDTIMIRNILVNIHPGSICSPDPFAGCFPITVTFDAELLSSLPPPLAP
jgi:PKD repeat protein